MSPEVTPPTTELESSAESPKIVGFKTGLGSVYTYDAEGKTTRYKTAAEDEKERQQERQDLTVFSPLSIEEEQDYLAAYRHDTLHADKEAKVYVVERQPDDSALIVREVSQVKDPEALYLVIVKNGQIVHNSKASLQPVVGYNVFDTRHFVEDGMEKTERHLGNKVTEIIYEA